MCLVRSANGMIDDVEPHLKHIADWYLVAHNYSSEDRFASRWNTDKHINVLPCWPE